MQLQVLQEDLSKALLNAIRFTSSRATLPILGNFLLVAEKTKLKIMATNLEMSVCINIGAKVEKEGSITVPAKLFQELIGNLGIGQITITLEKDELKVESASFKGKLLTTPPNDFPKIPQSLDSKKSFTLASNALINTLSKIIFSASSDETRPVLTGVLFIFNAPKATNSSSLSLVSSDGFRLSKKTIPLPKKVELGNIVLPKSSLTELIKIAKDSEIELELKDKENQLLVKVGETYLSTRLIEGKFPDFEKIIPKSSGTMVSIDKNDLARGIRLSGIFANENDKLVKIAVKENSLQITSESEKGGKEENEIEAKVEGSVSAETPLFISFNYKFIEEFLSVAEGDSIEIKLIDSISPAIFVDTLDKDFLHLIMPVRVQG